MSGDYSWIVCEHDLRYKAAIGFSLLEGLELTAQDVQASGSHCCILLLDGPPQVSQHSVGLADAIEVCNNRKCLAGCSSIPAEKPRDSQVLVCQDSRSCSALQLCCTRTISGSTISEHVTTFEGKQDSEFSKQAGLCHNSCVSVLIDIWGLSKFVGKEL